MRKFLRSRHMNSARYTKTWNSLTLDFWDKKHIKFDQGLDFLSFIMEIDKKKRWKAKEALGEYKKKTRQI